MSSLRKKLGSGLRLAMLVVLLGSVFHFGFVSRAALVAVLGRPGTVCLALIFILIGSQLNIVRWYLLLKWQGSGLSYGKTWKISYISFFVGSFLPGVVGSDALRALYVHRECLGDRTSAFLTIVFDRMLGLASLLILTLGIAAALPHIIRDSPIMTSLMLATAGVLVGIIVFGLLSRWSHKRLLNLFAKWPQNRIALFCNALLSTIALVFDSWRDRSFRLPLLLAIGVFAHGSVVVSLIFLARGSGVTSLTALELALSGTLAVLVNQLPLTPGGIGLGEASFAQLCAIIAPETAPLAYGTVIFAFRVLSLLSFTPGAIIWISYGTQARALSDQALMKQRSSASSTASTPDISRPG